MRALDEADRAVINALQSGFPLCDEPYARVARDLAMDEQDLIERLSRLRAEGVLSRFGPLYNAEKMGGGLTLAALKVPAEDFDGIAETVNAFPEVAHNYQRDHELNMWFVLATETPDRIAQVIGEIEEKTGLAVYNMPRIEEYFIGLRFEA